MKWKTMVSALILTSLSCSLTQKQDIRSTPPAKRLSGVEKENFDLSVTPGEDFFRYVNGNWLVHTEIPADKSSYGSFVTLNDQANEKLKAIIDEIALDKAISEGSEKQKIRDLYKSFMDENAVMAAALSPLSTALERIEEIDNRGESLARFFAYANTLGINAPFSFYIDGDYDEPTRYIVFVRQAGLGLPDKEQYQDQELIEKYKGHIASMFRIAGFYRGQEADAAAKVVALESHLAAKQLSREALRNRDLTYNRHAMIEVEALMAGFSWRAFAEEAGIGHEDQLVIKSQEYMKALGPMLAQTDLATWKMYFKWQLLTAYAGYLFKEIDQADFSFYGTLLRGTQAQEPRWRRGILLVDDLLGEALGKEYVARHFQAEAKQRMQELVENLREAYRISLKELAWMGEDTKAKAIEKLANFTPKIGYPDRWTDYSALTLKPDDLVGNVQRGRLFLYRKELAKLGKPIDKHEWHMTPQTVNAYYNASRNEIVFPAAILQPPFFNLAADDAVNYGAIGAVIGHEMGHGFDDQGAKFNGDGKKINWWTAADLEQFKERTQKLVEQFNRYEALPGKFVNGAFTLGENIGDLGGLTIAYKAYQLSLMGKKAPTLDGFSGDQRFFIGWAQVWAVKYRDEELAQRLLTDPHAPAKFRVNGVVVNIPEFYDAFGIAPKSKLYLRPEERVKIW